MHELPLLINIAVGLAVAFFGGVIARRVGLPTIVGYMLAGIAIGPFTPGFVGDVDTVSQLAELGVIFLMFGVGLHFSFADLWKVRSIAIPGAIAQMVVATALGYWLTSLWGWSSSAGIVLGLALSIASTVVLLRGLMDSGNLNTTHGQAAVGWLVLEDIATILILVLLPVLAGTGGSGTWSQLSITLLKAATFVAVLMFVGKKMIPWMLLRIASTGSRELFILATLVISLGTTLGAAEVFGVSLALGAFVAGAVVGESPLSHQVSADLLPFREAFSVLFFVSIGMLVNPVYLFDNIGLVLSLAAVVVIGKYLITLGIGFVLPHPARTFLIVAAGLSQIGEFSFIVGQSGLALGLLTRDQYSLILAGSLLSITINPLMFRTVPVVEGLLKRMPIVWRRLDKNRPMEVVAEPEIADHVVVVGSGRVGGHVVDVLEGLGIPYLVMDSDGGRIDELNERGIRTLYGDAANSEVLDHAGLASARALVVTVPDQASAEVIVAAARKESPSLPIIVRAATEPGTLRLTRLGARDVVHPELEGGLQIVRRLLLGLGYPIRDVQRYADAVRSSNYAMATSDEEERRLLSDLLAASENVDIVWLRVPADSPFVGQTLAESNLRAVAGASIVAILRSGELIANPEPATTIMESDLLGVIGDDEQLDAARTHLGAHDRPRPHTNP